MLAIAGGVGGPKSDTACISEFDVGAASSGEALNFSRGEFSIIDWRGYPSGPRPTGPFRLLEGEEYAQARRLANAENKRFRALLGLDGLQIHEIQPVKFAGDPRSIFNKIFLPQAQHSEYTAYWNNFQRWLAGGSIGR